MYWCKGARISTAAPKGNSVHQLCQTRNMNYNKTEKEGDTSSRIWWLTGKRGMLQSMGSQRVGQDWVIELKLLTYIFKIVIQTWNGCTIPRVVYYTSCNNTSRKTTTDEYLYVRLKGYKNMYSYNNEAIWVNMDGPRDDHIKWSEAHRERKIPNDIT